MILLAHPNIWVEYIKNKGKITPSQNYREIFYILNNEENLFAYNYEWNSYYEHSLNIAEDEEIDYVDAFNNFIVELSYNDRLEYENYSPILSKIDFENCFLQSSQIQFLLLQSQTKPHPVNTKKGVLILDEIVKPNEHWIYYSILISNKSLLQSLDYRDFKSNRQIQEFIKCILNLRNPQNKRVYIQSDYLNYGQLFEQIIGKKITYCSSEYTNGVIIKQENQLQAEKISVKTYFGNNTSYRVSNDKRILHPRAIFYNNIVINLNHDFPQISIVNSNWHISFHYCKETYLDKLEIINNYKPV